MPIFQNSATFLVIAVSKIAVLPILAVALRPAEFGVYALVAAGMTFGVVAFGLNVNAYVSRSVPGMSVLEARRLVGTTALIEAGIAACVLAVAFGSGAASALLGLLNVAPYTPTFLVAGVWLVIELFNLNLRSYLFGRRLVTRANVFDLLRLASWIPLLLLYWGLRGALSVDVVIVLSVAGSLVGTMYGIFAVRPILARRLERALLRAALRFSVPLIVPGVSLAALRVADRSVLSATRSLEDVAAYSLAAGLATGLYSFTALSVETVLLPSAVRSTNRGDVAAARSVVLAILGYSVWSFSGSALALWLVLPLFAGFLSPEYATGLAVFPLIALGYVAIIASRAPHNALFLRNRTGVILACDVVTIAVAVLLDLLLIPWLGITGAAIASLIAFALNAAAKLPYSGLWPGIDWRSVLLPRWAVLGDARPVLPPSPE